MALSTECPQVETTSTSSSADAAQSPRWLARSATVLTAKGYSVFVQDYDIPLGDSFIDAMHEAIKSSRDLVILFTRDYETSAYTHKEFTSFEAQRLGLIPARGWRCRDLKCRSLEDYALLLTPQNKGSGACPMPLTFLRQA